MKKLLMVSLAIVFLLVSPSVGLAGISGQSLDQANSALPWLDCSQISNLNRAMIFKPSLNRITSVDLYLAARANGAFITLKIMRESDSSTIGETTLELSGGMSETWDTFSFSEPYVAVTPEDTYSLNLLSSEDQTRICYTGNNYARGFYRGLPDVDWLFKTYGINVSTATATTTSQASSSSSGSSASQTAVVNSSRTVSSSKTVSQTSVSVSQTASPVISPEVKTKKPTLLYWVIGLVLFLAIIFVLFWFWIRPLIKKRNKNGERSAK